MLVFVDESGDAGLKLDKGSSGHFIVALTIFNNRDEARKADNHVTTIRRQLSLRTDFEFHFHKTAAKIRQVFLQEMNQFRYRYFCIVINKAKLGGPGFKYPASFYKYACKLVCSNAKDYLNEAKVVIDGSGTREFKQQLANYLKKNVNDPQCGYRYIKAVAMEDSKKSNLLQLADMVAGSVARSYKGKKDSAVYRSIIRPKENYVQVWP
jgi:hypothetical protein